MLPPGISDTSKTIECSTSCDSAKVGLGTSVFFLDPCCGGAGMDECGLSTEQSLHVFAKEQRGVLPDIALEIGEVTRRVSAGSDLGEATKSVADEAGDAELSDLFAMMRQIDRYGGAVQEPLMRFAQLLEDRERTRLQEAIGKLSAKLTVAMVLFLLPALLTFVGGPGFVAVIRALSKFNA